MGSGSGSPLPGESGRRHVGIEKVVLRDVADNTAPPSEPVLMMQRIGSTVSLSIEKYEETGDGCSFKRVAQVIVDEEPLVNALVALGFSDGFKDEL